MAAATLTPVVHVDTPEPGPSSQTRQPSCTICNDNTSKYTCPGCKTRTCSAACSKRHKQTMGCSGERNKAAYVPLGEYGWGAMMDDYVFLEDMGRKVVDWGSEIVKGGYGHGSAVGTVGAKRSGMASGMRGGQGRGRGRGGGGGGGGARTKRDIFKMQLEIRDIDVELLPLGMKRRQVNQSNWDFRKQTGLLTIEFRIHRPRDPLAPSSTPDDPPLVLITHRNRMDKSLLTLLQSIVTERPSKKAATDNEWLRALVFPNNEDPEGFSPPHCVMSAPTVYACGIKKGFHKLDVNQPLAASLENTHFVEFPTIEVWEEFSGAIHDPQGKVNQPEEPEPEMKRRRLSKKAAKERISGLLGGYGSEEASEGGEGEDDNRNVLSLLGEYSDDDDVDKGETMTMSDDEDGEKELGPEALMELLRQVKGEQWATPGDDIVEWGDLSDADAEGEDDPGDEEPM